MLNFIPRFCIDNLRSHLPLITGQVGYIDEKLRGEEVAIIGAGMAGLVSAYELKKCGLRPIIYEATNRVGGRLYSKEFGFSDSDKPIFAELGAMRMPKCSELYFYYLQKFGIQASGEFPDPGLVDTLLAIENKVLFWPKGQPIPPEIRDSAEIWSNFITPICDYIHGKWKNGDLQAVHSTWEFLKQKYKNKSFYQVLAENSFLAQSQSHITDFGVLGIGTGGFRPLFEVSFIEILRVIVNTFEVNQISIADSVQLLPVKIANEVFGLNINLENKDLKLNHPVVEIEYNTQTNNPVICYRDGKNNSVHKKEYKAVIFTGTSYAAQFCGLTGVGDNGVGVLDEKVRLALREQKLISASKAFFCTEKKFWKKGSSPQVIISDGICKGTYFLDYPHTKHGVVCLSYTWGSDSEKTISYGGQELAEHLVRNISKISPEIAANLKPINNEIIDINWQSEKYYHGAFKLNTPGQIENEENLYNQFKSVKSDTDKGVYLAGDGIGWSAGWVETAIYTAINASHSVILRLGGRLGDDSIFNK